MGKNIRVLHVDDDKGWRDRIARILSATSGVDVESFRTLADAQQAEEPDVYLVDGSIDEEYDGITWAQRLRQAGKKVVVLSAGSIPEELDSVNKADFGIDFSATLAKLLKMVLGISALVFLFILL